jgi:hypothetical protein
VDSVQGRVPGKPTARVKTLRNSGRGAYSEISSCSPASSPCWLTRKSPKSTSVLRISLIQED